MFHMLTQCLLLFELCAQIHKRSRDLCPTQEKSERRRRKFLGNKATCFSSTNRHKNKIKTQTGNGHREREKNIRQVARETHALKMKKKNSIIIQLLFDLIFPGSI